MKFLLIFYCYIQIYFMFIVHCIIIFRDEFKFLYDNKFMNYLKLEERLISLSVIH